MPTEPENPPPAYAAAWFKENAPGALRKLGALTELSRPTLTKWLRREPLRLDSAAKLAPVFGVHTDLITEPAPMRARKLAKKAARRAL